MDKSVAIENSIYLLIFLTKCEWILLVAGIIEEELLDSSLNCYVFYIRHHEARKVLSSMRRLPS
ncbi:hypothetical protein [cyanobacterium endosymbiont of Rhopalodia gibberula]|uniref:hypothetical protein n=1 Tax=cyanobacterium endosymbiont of Rhopalodia gibberula TaxID=1763363 RepID=UPI001559774E|nr:hypothetical protein [cyanobacterium endosymbiont of Rhopalodia gibberula]